MPPADPAAPSGIADPDDFRRLAAELPAFTPGACPAGAAAYLSFYQLALENEFPQTELSIGQIPSDDHRIALYCWRQSGASDTLLLVHGYFDHVGLYGHLVRAGLARGCNVVAFDLPGHGLSSGRRAEIDDFAEYSRAIAAVLEAVSFLPGRRDCIAQSTGGAAVMDYLQTGQQPDLDRIVLLAPLVRPHGWWRVRALHELLHRFVSAVPRDFADNSQDPDFIKFLHRDPLQSNVIPACWVGALRRWLAEFLARPACNRELLIIQGDADKTVDWRYNLRQLARLFPAAEVFHLAGGRHHLANESADLRAEYLARINRFLDET